MIWRIGALGLLVVGVVWQVLPVLGAAAPGVSGGVQWLSDLQAAKKLSARSGKSVLVDFSATWCGPCQAMIHETFPDPNVAPLLEKLICVRIDVDQDPKDAAQFGVDGIPRLIMLVPTAGAPAKMDVTGYEEPVAFANDLRTALGMPLLSDAAQAPAQAADSPADTVAQALAANRYGTLKQSHPAAAKEGLADLVAGLGASDGGGAAAVQPDVLARAGSDADAALLAGMGSGYLAERVGAFAMLRRLFHLPGGSAVFDPWARKPIREAQLKRLAARVGRSTSTGA